jgi:subfamily B ATP-binding cassette protein MsbA
LPNQGAQVYKRLLQYVRPYWKVFVPAIIAMILAAAVEAGFPALMKPMLDGSFVDKDPVTIKWIPILLVLMFFLRGLTRFISKYCMGWIGRTVVNDLRSEMFAHALKLPITFYDDTSSGNLLSRFMYNVEQVAQASTTSITTLIRDSLTLVGLFAYMFYISFQLAFIFLMVGPLVGLIIRLISTRMRKLSHTVQDSMGEVSHNVEEVIEGQKVVKLFAGQSREKGRFSRVLTNNRHQQLKFIVASATITPAVQMIAASALAGIIYLATSGALAEEISVGSFVSFIIAMTMLLPPLKRLTQVNTDLQKGIAAGESIFELLDLPAEIDTGKQAMGRAEGRVEFEQVSHRYATSNADILSDISFSVEPGTSCAFVGRSGGGKSTIIHLLTRFYDASEGVIRIDDIDIRELPLLDLRRQIALVSQDITLFNDTIAANIAYGCPDASREQVIEAARTAHALEFIERLANGFDSLIGENGVLLSGGQRQRLAIARAVLKDAPILVLDEATAALDTESERHIQQALESLMETRTTLMVAHRLSTIENADQIVVLDQGKIIERGQHQQLLDQGGAYAELCRVQFAKQRDVD